MNHATTSGRPPSGRRHFLGGLVVGGIGGALATWLGWRSPRPASSVNPADHSSLDHEKYMRLAIALARKVPQFPFGAVIVDSRTGDVMAEGVCHAEDNPTYHGEMDAINHCAAKHPGIDWKPLVLYTTGESCPMCQAAICWARIGMVVYGTSIPVLQEYGFGSIDIRSVDVVRHSHLGPCIVLGDVLEAECTPLFRAASQGAPRKQE